MKKCTSDKCIQRDHQHFLGITLVFKGFFLKQTEYFSCHMFLMRRWDFPGPRIHQYRQGTSCSHNILILQITGIQNLFPILLLNQHAFISQMSPTHNSELQDKYMCFLAHGAFRAKTITVIDHPFIITNTKQGDFQKCLKRTYAGQDTLFLFYMHFGSLEPKANSCHLYGGLLLTIYVIPKGLPSL